MLDKNRDIDWVFREKLEGFEQKPPAFVWDNIHERLMQQKREKLYALFRRISVAAVVLMAFVAGWWITNSPDTEEVVVESYQNYDTDISNVNSLGFENAKEVVVSVSDEVVESETVFRRNPVSVKQNIKKANTNNSYIFTNNNFSANSNKFAMFDRQNGFPLASYDNAGFLSKISEMMSAFEQKIEKAVNNQNSRTYSIAESNKTENYYLNGTVYPEPDNQVNKSVRASRWSLKAMASPSFWGNMPGSSENAFGTVAETTLSGGLLADYKLNKRFSVRGGMGYSKIKHSTDQVSILSGENIIASNRSVMNTSSDIELMSAYPNSAGLGTLNMDQAEKIYASNYSFRQDVMIPNEANVRTDTELTQNMEYLEVPFIVSYKLLDSNVNIEINGGISTNFLIGNSANVYAGGDVFESSKTANIRDVAYASTFGIGIGYDISKKIAFSFEPQIKYFMNSISSNEAVEYRPYRIGLYAGVTYSFN
jgi:hypothetical protein